MAKKTLLTCALPYANGAIHLGHMVEHIQADIHVRYLRSAGEDVVFLCADDTHGSAIELAALKEGLTPEAYVARVAEGHQRDFADFGISFDHYGSTNSPENRRFAELIYTRAKEAGSIGKKEVEQPYDEQAGRWLSDRFIRGTCPNCKTPDQYGDGCEKCLTQYSPRELVDARSAISGAPLVWKKSSHAFFLLSKHADFVARTINTPGFMNPGPAAQLGQFFTKGLADWDITRDGPYFGFPIPGETNQFFYVWLDAPIGYVSTTEQWAKKTGKAKDALAYWDDEADVRIVHVIGKDIVYFHCLFWPAVLEVAGLKVPDHVHIHGHLTVNGEKMSKSRGTFINARPYLDLLDPNYLRFYYASLLGPGPEDLDFQLTEFRERVNAELVNNLGNLASRLQLLARPPFDKKLAAPDEDLGEPLFNACFDKVPAIRRAFANFDHRAAVREILEIGRLGNQFLTRHEPWKLLKTNPELAQRVLSEAAVIVSLLATLLEPIVPALSAKLFAQLGRKPRSFKDLEGAQWETFLDRKEPIGDPAPLIGRLEPDQVAKLIAQQQGPAKEPKAEPKKKEEKAAPPPPPAELEYADFAKVALKVGKVLAAEKVPKADKLLKLSIDLGEGAPRTIVSGIAEAYAPEAVVGRNVVVVANLKPRALKGIESKGMILTAGPGGKELVLLDPGAMPPGAEVK